MTIHTGMLAASTLPADRIVHSLRFAYNRYTNKIVDAVAGSNIFNPAPGVSLNFTGGSGFASGPNSAGPAADQAGQQTGPLRRHPDLGKPHLPLRRGGEQD